MRKFNSILLVLATSLLSGAISAQNAVTPGSVRLDATFENVSVNYSIDGDVNRNSNLVLRYKELGAAEFLPGAITMRAFPGMVIDGEPTSRNFHAGSIMFLNPGSAYEIELDLSDPDGGGSIQSLFVQTKEIPQPPITANIRYVSPGNGGGNGTQGSPYLGLQAAADAAQQGDHFVVSPGTYAPFIVLNSGTSDNPITFSSEIQHEAIIDGDDTSVGIVIIGSFDQGAAHIIMDGFVIQNGHRGIDAQNTQHITIRNNIIQDVDYGFVNRREEGLESDQYITNNLILGNNEWPQDGIPSERGIDLRGNNNVVSFNTIKNFGDGVSTDGPAYETSYSIDIHNNDIQTILDDLIEVDGIVSNARIYANQCFNGRAGISVAPIYGGPVYVLRNVIFNLEISAFKMNRGPSGIVAVHNTAAADQNVVESPEGFQNTYFRNNVFLASRYCFEFFGLVEGSTDDWDNGAYYSTRGGEVGTEWFKWNDIRYAQVAELQNSGILEPNAIEVAFSDFVNGDLPDTWPVEYEGSQRDFSPVENSVVRDNGADIAHLNGPFVSDGLPDRGALEYGEEIPPYGHDFDMPIDTGMDDLTTQININVFPNPINDKVWIDGDFNHSNLQIFNLSGQKILAKSKVILPLELDLSKLETGMYFLQLSDASGAIIGSSKLIKQ